jgi:MFS family permease
MRLGLVMVLFWFSLYTYVPLLSPHVLALGASYQLTGLIVGAYGLVQLLVRVPLGVVSDLIGRRSTFARTGLALGAVSALGMSLVQNPLWLLPLRALAGAAASTWVAFSVLFAGYFQPGDATWAMGLAVAASATGQVTGSLLGGFLSERLGTPAAFLAGAAGGLAGLLAYAGLPESPPPETGSMQWPELLRTGLDRRLLAVSGLALVYQVLVFGTVYGFTPVAARAIGAGGLQLGFLNTLSTLPRLFASAAGGYLCARFWGERTSVALGFALMAVSCLAIARAATLPALYTAQVLSGFGQGLVFPLLMALSIKRVPPARRATAMGVFQAVYSLGMFGGPVVVGAVAARASLAWGFWVSSAVGWLGAVLSLFVLNRLE